MPYGATLQSPTTLPYTTAQITNTAVTLNAGIQERQHKATSPEARCASNFLTDSRSPTPFTCQAVAQPTRH
eukprot:1161149-Pelagomonas_calceolata.AAC.2